MKRKDVYDGSGLFCNGSSLDGIKWFGAETTLIGEYIDNFNPQRQWSVSQNIKSKAIVLIDHFLPPSQTGKAPKLDGHKTPGLYTPTQIEARTPSSSLFNIGRNFVRGIEGSPTASYGSTGPFRVEDFNITGFQGSVLESSPTVTVTNEWLKRMGVVNYSWWNPSIQMKNGYNIGISVTYDNGIGGTPYDGRYSPGEIADIGYSMIMLSHYYSKYGGEDGSFFVRVNVGRSKDRFLVVDKRKNIITCHLRAEKCVQIAKQLLLESGNISAVEKLSADIKYTRHSDLIDLMAYALGDAESMYDYALISAAKENASNYINEAIAFEINIPDARDSIQ